MRIGKVLQVYIAPEGTSGVRDKKDYIELKSGHGISDDKFAGKDLEKTVMIIGTKPYSMAKEKGIILPECALGENILLDFDPHELEIGSILQIGGATVEITQCCTLCKHLTKYDKTLPKLILNHRGIYCKIVKSGKVKANDEVMLLAKSFSAA